MRTTLELNEKLFNKAKQILGAATIQETVEKSLQAVTTELVGWTLTTGQADSQRAAAIPTRLR